MTRERRLDRKPNPNAGWTRDANWNLQGKWLYKESGWDDDGNPCFHWEAQAIFLKPTLHPKTGELAWRWTYHSQRGWPDDYPHEDYCDQIISIPTLAEAKAWAEDKLRADE